MSREIEERILICGPLGRDGKLISEVLGRNSLLAESVSDMPSLCSRLDEGAGAIVITEEALQGEGLEQLRKALERQATWSDLPVLLLTSRDEARSATTWDLVTRLGPGGNISLLERPLRMMTLVRAVEVALRARRRQYELRAFHEELERRVNERTELLVEKNHELEGFTYSVSHDMRTPLRAIVAHATIMLDEQADRLDSRGKEGLERLAAAARKMAQLVDDLLKYARLGTRDLRTEPVDLGELAREEAGRIQAERSECALEIVTHGDLVAVCDPRLMGMALANFIDNACKYRKRGETHVRVEIGAVDKGGERTYYVRDEGIGFDMKYAPKLFHPFERLHRDAEYAGTGIGLANVRRVIERHGGRVWAESEPDRGTTFWFVLGDPNP